MTITVATGAYLKKVDCERRLTPTVLLQLFDDDGSGTALDQEEEDGLRDVILDSESEVEQVISKTYGKTGLAWLRTQAFSAPRSVKRMMLDVFEVRAYRRLPSYVRAEWEKREAAVDRDLKALQVRECELDTVSTPDPAVNEGGDVQSGDPDNIDPKPKAFLDGMGAF